MKINQVTQAYGVEFQKAAGKVQKNPKDEKPARGDSVTVSKQGRELRESSEVQNTASFVKGLPEVRQEKVQEVKEKVQNGFYDTPEFMDALADRLMKEFGLHKA